jgi:hypothetical protein
MSNASSRALIVARLVASDYAVLMPFATYGLWAQEVAALELSAIDWPRSRFHVLGRKAGNSTT